jgi:hypothetical protein
MKECSSPASSALTGGENSERRRLLLPGHDLRTWLIAVPLALVVIAAFIPAEDNGFVDWDDDQNFLDNPFDRGLGAPELKWAWTTFRLGVYQPLAWMLFEGQYVFWKLDSHGYHVTSVILHVANAIVLYVLTVASFVRCQTDSWRKCPWTCSLGAGFATALFMAHPLRVEAVAWASCQPYLPCALFSMLAILAYLRAFEISSSYLARASSGRPRLIIPRPSGLTPAMTRRGKTWSLTACARGKNRAPWLIRPAGQRPASSAVHGHPSDWLAIMRPGSSRARRPR